MKNLLQFGSLVIAITTLMKKKKQKQKQKKKQKKKKKKKKTYLTGNSDFPLKSLMTVNWK